MKYNNYNNMINSPLYNRQIIIQILKINSKYTEYDRINK